MKRFLSNIPLQWKLSAGRGVNVGIIDAGFDVQNIHLKSKIKGYLDLGSSNVNHGTHVMGIMCLQTDQTNVINGLANKSKYYLVSIPFGSKQQVDKKLQQSLTWLMQFNIDVLNMSFTYKYQNKIFKQMLLQLHQKNTIIVNSYSNQYKFPHNYQFVISAGLQLTVKDNFMSSVSNNQFAVLSGTSMQSAFVSSVAAIAKSYNKKINKDLFLKSVCGEQMLIDDSKLLSLQTNIKL